MNHANFAETTLAAAITDTTGTAITVTSETSFPAAQFIISIDTEAMLVTNVAGTTWTVTRGYEGSTAATHLIGTAIYHDLSAAEADAIAAKLPLAGGTMTGNLVMDNMDVTLVRLLALNGEIDDEAGAAAINWNAGAAHKATLGAATTLVFTGIGGTVVPTMTSNTAPSGVASCSDVYSGNDAYRAFDKNNATEWWGNTVVPSWVQYQFTAAKTIYSYSVYFLSASSSIGTLLGSNNGADWTTLDVAGSSFAANTLYHFTIDIPASYQYYRFRSATQTPRLATLSLVDVQDVANPPAPCFLTLKLVQDATGGRTVTWPATVKGTPAINKAANAISNILFYFDGTNYYVLNGLQYVSATDKVLGRSTAGAGDVEEIACTAAGRALLDDATATAQIATLGLDADLTTLALPANTTITAVGAELINDADVAAQLVTLGTAAYSEGTWTPVLNSFDIVGAAPTVSGTYKRIGNLVFITCFIGSGIGGNTSVAGTTGVSNITGIPFSAIQPSPGLVVDGWAIPLGIGYLSESTFFPPGFTANAHTVYVSVTYSC